MIKKTLLFIVPIFLALAPMVNAKTGTIHIEISGINGPKGSMSIGLYSNEEGFPDKGKEYKGTEVKVTGPTLVYSWKDVPHGSYAIAIFHDSNSNGILDTNFVGIPREGYAFSNNRFGAFGLPPSFKDASFTVTGDRTITIKIKY